MNDLRLPKDQSGVEIVTFPGMNVEPIVIPSGGVTRNTPPGTGG
jgi:hypothetical protein